jgi:hypothetical protein
VEAVTKVRLMLAAAGANAAEERVIRGKRNNKTFFVFIIMVLGMRTNTVYAEGFYDYRVAALSALNDDSLDLREHVTRSRENDVCSKILVSDSQSRKP